MLLKLFISILSLAGSVFIWWVKNDAEKKKRLAERKKEIHEAVYSGDVSRINSIVQQLRK